VTAVRDAFTPLPATALAVAGSLGVSLTFLHGALAPADTASAAFAACFLALVFAACTGPFLFGRRPGEARLAPAVRGGLRAVAYAAGAALLVAVAGATPSLALACGLYAGLFAFTLAALADLMRAGPFALVVAAAALASLATFFYWDDAFLLAATDRKATAALAFQLNPAAPVSLALGFDWIHAKVLYTGNETAESLVQVPVPGLGAVAGRLAVIAAAATGLGAWRRR